MSEIKMGNIVEDRASGFQGTVIGFRYMLGGTVQASIQPRTEDVTKLPDAYSIDIQQLTFISEGLAATAIETKVVSTKLGDEVQDTITGFKGIAVEKLTYLNGCVRFNVQGKTDKLLNSGARHDYFDSDRLKVTKTEKVTPSPVGTGGPSELSLRF